MDNSALDVRPTFALELTSYYIANQYFKVQLQFKKQLILADFVEVHRL